MEFFLNLSALILTVAGTAAAYAFLANTANRRFYSRFDRAFRSLPLLNCGVCGFSECAGFAAAVVAGNASPSGCAPGGPKTAHALADIMETIVDPGEPMKAAVHCKGGSKEATEDARYEGVQDCDAAMMIGNGVKLCAEGCLGLGTCVRACPFNAIRINEHRVAVVERQRCNGCGSCIAACPRGLLSLIPHVHKIYLACANHDRGDRTASYCSVGCTACGECVKITPSGAITMRDRLPHLDYFTPSENFVAAAYRCPSKCFVDLIKARPKANIDTKCDGCGDCIPVCPVPGAIIGEAGKRHVIKKDLCIGCGRCAAICRVRSISLWGSLGYETAAKGQK